MSASMIKHRQISQNINLNFYTSSISFSNPIHCLDCQYQRASLIADYIYYLAVKYFLIEIRACWTFGEFQNFWHLWPRLLNIAHFPEQVGLVRRLLKCRLNFMQLRFLTISKFLAILITHARFLNFDILNISSCFAIRVVIILLSQILFIQISYILCIVSLVFGFPIFQLFTTGCLIPLRQVSYFGSDQIAIAFLFYIRRVLRASVALF